MTEARFEERRSVSEALKAFPPADGVPGVTYRTTDVSAGSDFGQDSSDPRRFVRYCYTFSAPFGSDDETVLAVALGRHPDRSATPLTESPFGQAMAVRDRRIREVGAEGGELQFIERMIVETKPDSKNDRLLCRIIEDFKIA